MTENVYAFVSHSVSHTALARCLVILGEGKRTNNEAYCIYVLDFFVIYLQCVLIASAVSIWYHIAFCDRTINA